MKPCKLTLTAFGPFATSETIDFTKLPTDALFLIHGPTGAGKTSILDGICYALYGVTSGDERTGKQMRSQHAPENLQTEIELEFKLGSRLFRIRRTPDQERLSQRATKSGRDTVDISSTAELSEFQNDEWVPLANKTTEVTAKIVELIGFQAEQFRQVIMLPQGKFRDFLSASSKAREEILEALFSTAIYKQLQDRLRESARSLELEAKEISLQKNEILNQVAAENEDVLAKRIQDSQEQILLLDKQAKVIKTQEDSISNALKAEEALLALFNEYREAEASLNIKLTEETEIRGSRLKYDMALKANHVIPFFKNTKFHKQQLDDHNRVLSTHKENFDKAFIANESAKDNLKIEDGKQSERDFTQQQVTRLEELRDSVKRFNEAESIWNNSKIVSTKTNQKFEHAQFQLNLAKQERDSIVKNIQTLTQSASLLESLHFQKEKLLKINKILSELSSTKTELNQLELKAKSAESKFKEAEKSYLDELKTKETLEEAWRNGQAFVLAQHLSDGSPCPVCGSQNHPHPALDEISVPNDINLEIAANSIKVAQQNVDVYRKEFDGFEKQLIANKTAIQISEKALSEYGSDEVLNINEKITASNEALKASENAKLKYSEAVAKLNAHEQHETILEKTLESNRVASESARQQEASAFATYQERKENTPEQYHSPEVLESAINEAQKLSEKLVTQFMDARNQAMESEKQLSSTNATLNSAIENVARSKIQYENAYTTLNAELELAGIADESSLMNISLSADELKNLNESIKSYEQLLASAKDRFNRANNNVKDKNMPDIETTRSMLSNLRVQSDNNIKERESTAKLLEGDQRADVSLKANKIRLDDIENQFSSLGNLSDIANGKNGRNLTFQRYVLSALLDQVLHQASYRLRAMSHGRYTLHRHENVEDGRKASGLDLDVFDEFTGKARPATTLSGGEGFIAALSLALGLSDVVQSYAGGIQLDTLFIDEGFGSLDSEALDTALKTLIDLQQSGRMVGIISHVDELKRQIDLGIEVESASNGSHIRIFGGNITL